MLNLGKVLWMMIVSVCVGYAGSVTATVSTQEVVRGDAVTLSIKAMGSDVVFPQINKIGKSIIENNSTSSSRNISIINGSIKNESSSTKVLAFTPKEDMIIPSYEVNIEGKVYKTEPITLKLVKASIASKQQNQQFSLKLETSNKEVNIGESFMVTAYFALHRNVQIAQEIQYTPPSLSDFTVAEVAQKPAYMQGQYQIQEIQYIVTPLVEGNFSIDPAQVKVAIANKSRRGFFGMLGGKWYKTHSNALDITVLPQPKQSDVIGEFTVESTVDSKEVQANKPVNLKIKIEGNGNLQGFELPKYEIEGVTIYSDDAKIDTKVIDGKLYSIFTQSFALIASEDFSIPKVSFTSYSPKQKQLKEISVNGFDIDVKKTPYQEAMSSTPKGVVQSKNIVSSKEVIVEKIVEVENIKWWMLILAFTLGMLLMYLARFIPKLSRKSYGEAEALKVLYGQISKGKDVEAMVRQLYAKKQGDKSVKIDKKVLREMLGKFG